MFSNCTYGDARVKSKFLWFPEKIKGKWRWLCAVKYYEVFTKNAFMCESEWDAETDYYEDGWVFDKYI